MMTKKIYFLLAFLLTTLGGGNFALATDYVLSGSTRSGYEDGQQTATYVTNSKTITVTNNTDGRSYDKYTTYPDFIKTSHIGTSTINLANLPSSEIVTAISFKGFNNVSNNSSATSYISNVNGTVYSEIGGTNQFLNRDNISSVDDENIKTFTVSDLSIVCGPGASLSFNVSGGETNLIITITTELRTIDKIYDDSYPYTWDFTVETAKWSKSKAQMTNLGWNFVDTSDPKDGITDEARPNAAASNTGYDVDIIKGLRFTTSDAGSLCLDWTTRWIWLNGTVRLPALSSGHKVRIVSEAAPTSVSANLTLESTSGNSRQYLATADISTPEFAFGGTGIYSIAVTKSEFTMSLNTTDLTKYAEVNGGGESKNNSTDPGSLVSYSSILYDAAHPYIRMKLNLNKLVQSEIGVAKADYSTYFKITNSSDETVIDINDCYPSQVGGDSDQSTLGKGDRVYVYNVKMLKAGTSNLTFKFMGGDAFGYNENEITVPVVIIKGTQTLSFAENSQSINYGQSAPINELTHSVGDGAVTYSSSDEHVATVEASTGALAIHNAGTCTITATAAETDTYGKATASYELTVNGSTTPTLTWTTNSYFPSLNGTTLAYGNIAYCFATATNTGATVKYKSSNTKIATVAVEGHGGEANACKITPTGNGEVTITAYVEGSEDVNPAEISFIMTIEGQEVHMSFQPTSGTVKVGKTITPYISVPDIKMADITSVTVTTSDESKATVTAGETTETSTTYTLTKANGGLTSYTKDDTEYLEHIYATIKGEAATSSSVAITVTVNSDIYKPTTATYQVTVNDNDLNFNWEAPSQTYTLYTGDYMMIPAITGNANGNWSYSKGSTCESEQAYLYDIKSGTPTWNNRDFKIGEGIPDYRLYESDGTTVTDKAYIVWVNGQSVHTDVLMIYAKTAGTVKLHAKDPQTGASPVDITINIIDKSTLTSATTSYVNTMSFPYTWSFVGESSIATVSPNYWEDKGDYYTCGMSTAFNFDYCDEDIDGDTGEALKGKYFVDENGIMPQFYGMTVEFGNSGDKNHSYKAKEDKLRLYKYDSNKPDQPLLQVVGGTHKIALPAPGAGCPSNYKLFVKAKSRKDPARDAILQAYWSDSKKPYYSFTNNEPIIFSVDVTSGDPVKELWVSDVDIYWIAMSTEEKTLNYPKTISYGGKNITTGVTYAANTYSYNEDLDIVKSSEANEGVTAYYASSFTVDKDAAASDETGYAVTMTPANSLEYVKANTGLLLKKEASGSDAQEVSCYMIANPRNVDTYSADEKIDGTTVKNYLVGTGTSSISVQGWETVGSEDYTNFLMAYAYKYYLDLSNPSSAQGDYRFDRDWSFYPAMGSVTVPAQRAFLRIPQSLYVDKNGNIVEMPSNSRSHRSAEAAEAPATKAMLSIVFDDEQHGDDSGETTGINTVSERNIDSDAWFTLQGVRVNAPAKGGIYIHKGRKVVVK